MTTPNPNDPTGDATHRPPDAPPIYIDPVTHQQLYMDPLTGQLRYEPTPGAPPPPGSVPPAPGDPAAGQYTPGQYPPPGQFPPPGQYPPGQWPPAGQYPPPGQGPGPQYGYPPYGQYAYGTPYGYPPPKSTNGMAVASLITSIAGVLTLFCYGVGIIAGIVGAILGHVARRRIRESGQDGAGLALSGIIIGWIATGLGILGVIGLVVALRSS